MRRLSGALSDRGERLFARSVHWAPLLDVPQAKAMRALGKVSPVQRISQGMLADALSYELYRDAIHAVMDYEVRQLRADDFVIFAHSLGCTIALDYLRSRTRVRARLITLGNNVGLWYQGRESTFVCPSQVSRPGTWINVVDPEDGLGFKVNHWLPHVPDVLVEVGGLAARIVPALAHQSYWHDAQLWSRTLPGVLALLGQRESRT